MANKKPITMTDIAKELGISTVSVSKALQNKEGVSNELRSRILCVADKMGYRYNISAKTMKTGNTFNIGILVSERFVKNQQSFYWQICSEMNAALSRSNYFGIVETLSIASEKKLQLPTVLQSQKVDGLIILGQVSNTYLQVLCAEGLPLVLTDFYNESTHYASVTTDNFYSSYLITTYLLQCGHTKIGFVGSIHATSSILDRYLGFQKALLEHGQIPQEKWILEDRDESGNIEITAFPVELPTAFVCNCDEAAYKLAEMAKANGLTLPQELSLVGFDNNIFATISQPALTTVEVDTVALAQSSVENLFAQIGNKATCNGRTVIPGKLIFRDSVQKI